MQETPGREAKRPKKPYRKPELVQVELRAEEAVLANCKHGGTAGPGGVNNCSNMGPCSALGS